MTEQEKREMVIEGLEMSYTYSNCDEDSTLVPQQLVSDTVALLKAQEPKIISLRDVVCADVGNVVWLETYYDGATGIEPFLVDIDASYDTVLVNARDQYYLSDSKYLEEQVRESMDSDVADKKFRFWSSKPSDEQRKETKWE